MKIHLVPLIYGNLLMWILFYLHPEGPCILIALLAVTYLGCRMLGAIFRF